MNPLKKKNRQQTLSNECGVLHTYVQPYVTVYVLVRVYVYITVHVLLYVYVYDVCVCLKLFVLSCISNEHALMYVHTDLTVHGLYKWMRQRKATRNH